MSKSCEEKLICRVSSLVHPTVLHIKAKDRVRVPSKEEQMNDENRTIISGFVDIDSKLADNEAGGVSSTLAIVPVQVKAGKGSKVVNSYAFLDPGVMPPSVLINS